MPTWITPKYNWIPADGIANTDLNRIEGNNLVNYRRFEVSSTVNTGGTVVAGATALQQWINFTLPDGMKLVLKNARYKLTTAGLRLRVYYDIGAGEVVAWTSLSHAGDEEPDQNIYSNSTGVPVSGYYAIRVYNPTGGGLSIAVHDGWSLTFEKEENTTGTTAAPTTSTTTAGP